MNSTMKQRFIDAVNDPCAFVDGVDITDPIMMSFGDADRQVLCQQGLCIAVNEKFILTQAGADLLEEHILQ